MVRALLLFIFAFVPTSFGTWQPSAEMIQLEQAPFSKYIDNFYYYYDNTRELRVQDILSNSQIEWQLGNYTKDYFGYTGGRLWLTFSISAEGIDPVDQAYILYSRPIYSEWNLYEITPDGKIKQVIEAGSTIPPDQKQLYDKYPAAKLSVQPQEKKFYILSLLSYLPLKPLVQLTTEKQYVKQRTDTEIVINLYYGLMIGIILYNMFLLFFIKEKIYLYYILYVFFIVLTLASTDGSGDILFNIGLDGGWVSFVDFFQSLAILFIYLVSQALLHFHVDYPRFNKLVNVLVIVLAILAGLSLLRMFPIVSYLSDASISFTVVVFVISVHKWRKGYSPAKYFMFGWATLVLAAVIFFIFNYMPGFDQEAVRPLLYLGTGVESLLFSVSLANRYNFMKKEKEREREMALANMEAAHALKSQFVETLEIKVKEKTEELQKTQLSILQSSKWKAIGQMANGIAHEINNPLMIIEGYTDRIAYHLANNEQDKNEAPYYVDRIKTTIGRIAHIIRQLQTFSVDKPNSNAEFNNANQLIESTLELIQGSLRDHNIVIHFDQRVANANIICHENHFKEVLLILIDNAKDALVNEGEKWIKISLIKQNTRLHIRVTNNGARIPLELTERIFEPFFTSKHVGEGLGLNLSAAKNTVRSWQGDLYLDATHAFTSFVIELPLMPPEGEITDVQSPTKTSETA